MSGGHFNYEQYRISLIADEIERLIDKNGSSETNEWGERRYEDFPPDIIAHFAAGVIALRIAHVYAQRIDWLLSGDDNPGSFRKRLAKDLSNLTTYKQEES